MHSFPAPALRLVETMQAAAALDPQRAMSFQGAPGSNSHRAASEFAPDALPLPLGVDCQPRQLGFASSHGYCGIADNLVLP